MRNVSNKIMSLRKAEAVYGIPKSTILDYVSGKVKLSQSVGPSTVLTMEEETRLADWAVEMEAIGYGLTK